MEEPRAVILTPALDKKAVYLLKELVDGYDLTDKAPADYMADLGRLAVALIMESIHRRRLTKTADHLTILRIVTEFYRKSGITFEPGENNNYFFGTAAPK